MVDVKELFKQFKDNNNIKDGTCLDIDQDLPEDLIYEREPIQQIAEDMAVFLKGGPRTHILAYGSTGTGKTGLIRYLIQQFKQTLTYESHYLNCRHYNTSYRVLQGIMEERKKIPYTKLRQGVNTKLTRGKHIIVLDEIDMLKDDTILYSISRDPEMRNVLLILITNKTRFFKDTLTEDTRSSLNISIHTFKDYDANDLHSILKLRCDKGLLQYHDSVIMMIAGKNAKDFRGDARVSIKTAGTVYRFKHNEPYSEEMVSNIMRKEATKMQEQTIFSLTDKKLILLHLCTKTKERNKIYQTFKTLVGEITYTYFREFVADLEKLDLLWSEKRRIGRSDVIFLNHKLEEENRRVVERQVSDLLSPGTQRLNNPVM